VWGGVVEWVDREHVGGVVAGWEEGWIEHMRCPGGEHRASLSSSSSSLASKCIHGIGLKL